MSANPAKRQPKRRPTEAVPKSSVYDGVRLLGHILQTGQHFKASAAKGSPLGDFKCVKDAVRAIVSADSKLRLAAELGPATPPQPTPLAERTTVIAVRKRLRL